MLWENWSRSQHMQVEALKALSIKLINTATFVYQLYRIQTGSSGDNINSIRSTDTLSQVCVGLSRAL